MKRYFVVSVLICIALTSIGFAEMMRQIWEGNITESLPAVRDFHADKRPGMELNPPPDLEDVLDVSWWGTRADNYWANLWGWVTIPTTGTYTWHVHGDNNSILLISTDESMDNVEEVATVDGWSDVGQWDKFPTQTSDPFAYTAGQVLAVWGIMVEGGGGDDLGIGWTMPGAGDITYITDHVTIVPPTPTKAKGADPEVGATDVARDLALSWVSGKFAAKHDVYLGTSLDDVNNASIANPLDVLLGQGLTDTSVDPGRLAFGQTYYWRVDEVNSPPDNTVYAGKIWEFTVEPYGRPITNITATASSSNAANMGPEKTIDGSGINALDQHSTLGTDMWLSGMGDPTPSIQYEFDKVHKLANMLVWNSNQMIESFIGLGAKDVVVEYSPDGVEWIMVEGATLLNQATGAEAYAANTDIDFGGVQAKSVRITINAGYGMLPQFGLSEVRILYVPTFAREPQPASGSTTDSANVVLGWRSGREAASSEIYLGTDAADLALLGTTSDNGIAADGLNYSTTYFWSVTEVNNAEAVTTYAGDVWSFTTPD